MLLKLSVVTYQDKTPHFPEEYTFGSNGGSIGRGAHNDWVLEDQYNFLSKQHASISFHQGSFIISDLSTNGVFVNHQLLGKGNEHAISSSDHIKIGDYEIVVSELDLLEDNSQNFPFSEDIQKTAEQDHSSFTFQSSHESKVDDPFNDLFNPPSDEPEYQHHVDSYANSDNAFSFDSKPTSEQKSETSDELHAAFAHHQDSPSSNQTGLKGSASTPLSEESLVKESVELTKDDIFNENIDTPPLINDPSIPVDKAFDINSTDRSSSSSQNIQTDSAAPGVKAIVASGVTPEKTNANQHALEQILLGADLSKDDTPLEASDETFKLIGNVLKESLDGAMSLLRSRTEAKNHLRLDKTLLGSQENNPLKFFPTSKHVLKMTLAANNQIDNTYLPLVTALQEAYDDIQAHEFSMTSSIQGALSTTIKLYFSPENIQNKLEKNSPISAKIPLQREAKLWHMFTDIYDEIAEEACESFQTLLDKEIANAYEIQTKEIKAQRKNKTTV